MNLKRHR